MAVTIQSAFARSPRRVRVVFGGPLGLGAFSSAYFRVSALSEWGTAASPAGVLAVADRPTDAELLLDRELSPGARYLVQAVEGIPDAIGDVSPGSEATLTIGQPLAQASAEVSGQTMLATVFQDDLSHDGSDFIEDPRGDLGVVRGVDNGRAAVRRRAVSAGLMWDDTYGPGLRDVVDAPIFGVYALRGRIVENLRMDDRVKSADIQVGDAQVVGGDVIIPIDIEFVGGLRDSVAVEVPVA